MTIIDVLLFLLDPLYWTMLLPLPGQTDGMFNCCDYVWTWYSVLIYDLTLIVCCQIIHTTNCNCDDRSTFICLGELFALHEQRVRFPLRFVLTYGVSNSFITTISPSYTVKIYADTDDDYCIFIFIESMANDVSYGQTDCTFLPFDPLGCCSPF